MPNRPEPPRCRESLREYEPISLPEDALTDRDLTVLQTLAHTDLFSLRKLPGVWELRPGPVVGVLALDRVILEIHPKIMINGEQVMAWICYALSQPTQVKLDRRWTTCTDGMPDLIVATLIAECRILLRDQLRRDYRRQDLVEPVLRGRLDIAKQYNRRFGQLDRLHVQTFDRDIAVWENLACHSALRRAARVASSPELKYAARDVAADFPACTADQRTVRRWLSAARYHRINARYQPAHTWAALLLGGGGLSDLLVQGPQRADSLLVNMNRLWEAVIRRLAADAAANLGGASVHASDQQLISVREQGHPTRAFRPDVLLTLRTQDPSQLPVDAKYKRYDQHAVGPDDVHQLLTYAHGYLRPDGLPRAVIVHPSELSSNMRRITVRDPSGRQSFIGVVGLDVQQSPQQATTALTMELKKIVDTWVSSLDDP